MADRPGVLHVIELSISNPWLRGLAKHLDRDLRMAVTSLRPAGALQVDLAADGVPSASLDATSRSQYPRVLLRLRRLLRRTDSRILHTHSFDASVIGMVASALPGGARWVYTHHHQPHFFELTRMAAWKRPLIRRLDRLLAQRARAVVAPSRPVAEVLTGWGIPPERIHLIPIGFDLERLRTESARTADAARRELGLEGVLSALSVGRLSWEKGHETTLRAWQRVVALHPGARLLIAGVGPLGPRLSALAESLGIARNVSFVGFRADIPGIMAAVTLVIHGAQTESFGQSNAEALVLGRPLIATPTGIAAELADGRELLHVPHGDPEALLAAIERVAADQAFAQRLGESGRAVALARFAIEENARRYSELYRAVLAR